MQKGYVNKMATNFYRICVLECIKRLRINNNDLNNFLFQYHWDMYRITNEMQSYPIYFGWAKIHKRIPRKLKKKLKAKNR